MVKYVWYSIAKVILKQRSQLRTVPAGIYRTSQCTGTNTPCFVPKKIAAVPAVSAKFGCFGQLVDTGPVTFLTPH